MGGGPRVQGAGLKALVCIPGELGGRASPLTNGRSQWRSGQPCRFRAPANLSAVQPYIRWSITRTETGPKQSRRWDNLCGGHRTQLLKPTEEPIPLLAHSRHSDDTGVCPREQIGHEADGVECSFMTPKRTLMAFSGAKSAVHSSFKSEHLRAIVTPHRGDSHGE